MSTSDESDVTEVTEVDPNILSDLQSRYVDVRCPVHGGPPDFSVDEKGGVVESFCCETLFQIFRELKAGDTA